MPTIHVTPAGEQLYEVELQDVDGDSRHTVSVEDPLVEQIATDEMSMQDVVIAAMEFLTARVPRPELDRDISLATVAERYPGFVEQVPARARVLAQQMTAPPTDDEGAADAPTGDARLLAEVREEQAAGEVSQGRRHR